MTADGADPGVLADERTVVVERPMPSEEDRTVVVDRTVAVDCPADERTVVVDRAVDERTVVVERTTLPAEERTVVSGPGGAAAVRPPGAAAQTMRPGRSSRGSRSLRPAPVDLSSVRSGERASGPGVITSYAPRAEAAGVAVGAPPVVLRPAAATRDIDPRMPSHTRRSRRTAAGALAAFWIAAVGGGLGLVAIGLALVLG